jgi:hypothetical protein
MFVSDLYLLPGRSEKDSQSLRRASKHEGLWSFHQARTNESLSGWGRIAGSLGTGYSQGGAPVGPSTVCCPGRDRFPDRWDGSNTPGGRVSRPVTTAVRRCGLHQSRAERSSSGCVRAPVSAVHRGDGRKHRRNCWAQLRLAKVGPGARAGPEPWARACGLATAWTRRPGSSCDAAGEGTDSQCYAWASGHPALRTRIDDAGRGPQAFRQFPLYSSALIPSEQGLHVS